jgi:hypothetical protein
VPANDISASEDAVRDSVYKALLIAWVMSGGRAAAFAQAKAQSPPQLLVPLQDHQNEESDQPADPPSASGAVSRSKEVVSPPDIGDQIVKSPPKQGEASTPVIRPPGTPRGPQDVEPK